MVIHVRATSRICIPILMENCFDKNVYFYRLVIKLHPIQRFFFKNCSVSKNQIKLSKTLYCIIQYLSIVFHIIMNIRCVFFVLGVLVPLEKYSLIWILHLPVKVCKLLLMRGTHGH